MNESEMYSDVKVIKVTPLPGYRLAVEFEDGVKGEIDVSGELWGEVFQPLKDESFFRQVGIDEHGVVCWPNGLDLAPDAMHYKLASKSVAS